MNINVSDSRLQNHLLQAGVWTRRLSILFFVFVGFAVLAILGVLLFAGSISQFGTSDLGVGAIILLVLVYAGVLALNVYVYLKFYRFGKHLKVLPGQAISNTQITAAFTELATFYKIMVVLTLVTIGLSFLAFGLLAATGFASTLGG